MSDPSPIILSGPDSGSRGAGDMLKAAREAQGLTLERLASTIKVTVSKLDDLEQGRYDKLPDANFTRALAMTVCRALKLDPGEVLAALPAAKPIPLAPDKPPLNQPFKEGRRTGAPLFERQFDWSGVLSFRWLGPGLLLLAALVIYALPESVDLSGWVHRVLPAGKAEVAAAPASAAAVAVAVVEPAASGSGVAESAPDAASAVEFAPKSEAIPKVMTPGARPLLLDAPDGSASGVKSSASSVASAVSVMPVKVVQAPAPLSSQQAASAQSTSSVAADTKASPMVLDVRQSSWVEVRDAKGNKLISRQVQPGELLPLEGVAPLKLVIGYAPGIHVSFKGQEVDLTRYTQANVARLELK